MTTDLDRPAPDTEVERYKLCPTCRYATPASRDRCHHCLNDVANAQLLHPDAAARRLEEQAEREEDAARREAHRRQIRRAILAALAVAVVIWIGWQVYRTFIWEPSPVPLPGSTEPTMAAPPEAWPTSGGDTRATRATTASAALGPAEAWRTELGAAPATALVADTEQLYAVLDDGRLVAVRLADGRVAWETPLAITPIAAPTVAGDRIYIAMPGGQLVALDTATGDEVFASVSTGTRFVSAVVVDQGAAFVFGVNDLIAFDATTGDILWSREIDTTWATESPVILEDAIALASGDRSLLYDRTTGREIYFYEFERAHPYAIAASDGIIYTASNRLLAAYDIDSRRPWWEGMRAVWFQFEIWQMAPSVPPPPAVWATRFPLDDGYPMALDGTNIYLANAAGEVAAFSRETGEPAWETTTPAVVTAPIVTADGLLIARTDALALHDPATGTLLDERPIEGAPIEDVVVTNAGIFVFQNDGTVTALGSDG